MVLNGFFEGIGLADVSADVLRAIDKMEKITREELVTELEKICLTAEQTNKVLQFTEISGTNDEVLTALERLGIENETYIDGIAKLRQLIAALRTMKVPEKHFKIDLKIARGLDY